MVKCHRIELVMEIFADHQADGKGSKEREQGCQGKSESCTGSAIDCRQTFIPKKQGNLLASCAQQNGEDLPEYDGADSEEVQDPKRNRRQSHRADKAKKRSQKAPENQERQKQQDGNIGIALGKERCRDTLRVEAKNQ